MPSLTPSPPLSASSSRRGLVDTVAQTFAGVKTFLAAAVFSAGVQLSLLFGTNGSGAADVVIKAGTTLADASVNNTAKLWSVWTGLGGTEVERLTLTKNGLYFNGYPNSAISCSGSWTDIGVLPVRSVNYFVSTLATTAFYASGNGSFSAPGTFRAWSENASGASDEAAKIGAYTADASVNATTKLLNVSTGLGGTEVPSFQFLKGGVLWGNNAGTSVLRLNGTRGAELEYGGNLFTLTSIYAAWLGAGPFIVENTQSDAADRSALYANCRTAWTNLTSSLLMLQNNEVSFYRVDSLSRVHQKGVDRSGTIGADTQNNPIGINTLASGATSVVITNSLVSTASHVEVTFHADPGGRVWVTKAAGSFTVNVSAAPGANAPFSWEVKGLL